MTRFGFRRARAHEAPAIAGLVQRAHAVRRRELGFAGSELDMLPFVQAKIARPDGLLIVAEADAQVVAVGTALPAAERKGEGAPIPGLMHLSMIAVDPPFWGKGAGAAIVQHLLERTKALGFTKAQLWTQRSNDRAKRLYERFGFVAAGAEELDDRGELIERYVVELAS